MKLATLLSVSLISITLLLTGCGTTPATQNYILSSIDRETAVPSIDAQNLVIKVGPVSIPASLDQQPIVTRIGTNALLADEYNRWSGDYQSDIQRIMGENISILLPGSQLTLGRELTLLDIDFQVIINVREFDGALGGVVTLNANWTVAGKQNNKSIVAKKSVLQEKTAAMSYQDYAATQSRLLARLSEEIAHEIRGQLSQ